MDDIVVYPRKSALIGVAVFRLLSTAPIVILAVVPQAPWWLRAVLAVIALLIGAFSADAFDRLFFPQPTMIIDAHGITLRIPVFRSGRLRWEDITDISTSFIMHSWSVTRYLDITLTRDPSESNVRMINIPHQMLSVHVGELAEQIQAYYAALPQTEHAITFDITL